MKHKAVGIINSSVAIKASRIGAIAMNAAAVGLASPREILYTQNLRQPPLGFEK